MEEMEEIGMENNMPVWEWEDAVSFIAERCNIDRDTIEKVLELELDYERSVGIIDESEERFIISDVTQEEMDILEREGFDLFWHDGSNDIQVCGDEEYYKMALHAIRRI